jgi:putative membrane protein insertion efficiency factor
MKRTIISILIVGILCCLTVSPAGAEDTMQGPWDSWEKDSVEPVADNSVLRSQAGEFSFNPLVWGVRLFQGFVSSIDGARCSMYPTCSHYSLLAFKKHGPIMGYILTTDRLIHESDEVRFIPRVEKHGFIRFYDPLENNDFWWHNPESSHQQEETN